MKGANLVGNLFKQRYRNKFINFLDNQRRLRRKNIRRTAY